ncbi:hypothetical protein PVAND_016710 [Polypedilum vanderplanki]|uniref:Uncharacterized protein n=1 Tax=Polypedilum vanderplanki TaxID=319348 RepID=A0A9J6BGK7_POLVA|nr:hypothetical protein PVAND_016710 [Polypedilum vanderplanki]
MADTEVFYLIPILIIVFFIKIIAIVSKFGCSDPATTTAETNNYNTSSSSTNLPPTTRPMPTAPLTLPTPPIPVSNEEPRFVDYFQRFRRETSLNGELPSYNDVSGLPSYNEIIENK